MEELNEVNIFKKIFGDKSKSTVTDQQENTPQIITDARLNAEGQTILNKLTNGYYYTMSSKINPDKNCVFIYKGNSINDIYFIIVELHGFYGRWGDDYNYYDEHPEESADLWSDLPSIIKFSDSLYVLNNWQEFLDILDTAGLHFFKQILSGKYCPSKLPRFIKDLSIEKNGKLMDDIRQSIIHNYDIHELNVDVIIEHAAKK